MITCPYCNSQLKKPSYINNVFLCNKDYFHKFYILKDNSLVLKYIPDQIEWCAIIDPDNSNSKLVMSKKLKIIHTIYDNSLNYHNIVDSLLKFKEKCNKLKAFL